MCVWLGLVHLDLKSSRDGGDANLAIEPREQVAGSIGGVGDSGRNNVGLGHLSLVTQENTHHRKLNTR